MRMGVLITTRKAKKVVDIRLKKLNISDVFYENPGGVQTAEEVKSPNGTQKYSWGIRLINQSNATVMENIRITGCMVQNVGQTDIKLTGKNQNIQLVAITNRQVLMFGGPAYRCQVSNLCIWRGTSSRIRAAPTMAASGGVVVASGPGEPPVC